MTDTTGAAGPERRSLFLAAWGLGCFLLFLLSLGTAEYKYICAVASAIVMAWAYVSGNRFFSAGAGVSFSTLVPVVIGGGALAVLALAPLLTGSVVKYLAFVQALTGIRL